MAKQLVKNFAFLLCIAAEPN